MAFEEVIETNEDVGYSHCQAWVVPSTGKKSLEEFRKNTKLYRISNKGGKGVIAYHCRRPIHDTCSQGNLCYIHNKSFVEDNSKIIFQFSESVNIITEGITLDEPEFRKYLTDDEKKKISGITTLKTATEGYVDVSNVGDMQTELEHLRDEVEFLKCCFSKLQEENESIRGVLSKLQGNDSEDDEDEEFEEAISIKKTKVNFNASGEESEEEEETFDYENVVQQDSENEEDDEDDNASDNEEDDNDSDNEEDGMPSFDDDGMPSFDDEGMPSFDDEGMPSFDDDDEDGEIEVEMISLKNGKTILVDQISDNVYKSPDEIEEDEVDCSNILGKFLEVLYSNSPIEYKGDNYIVGIKQEHNGIEYEKCIYSNIAYKYDDFGRLYPCGRFRVSNGEIKFSKKKFKV